MCADGTCFGAHEAGRLCPDKKKSMGAGRWKKRHAGNHGFHHRKAPGNVHVSFACLHILVEVIYIYSYQEPPVGVSIYSPLAVKGCPLTTP